MEIQLRRAPAGSVLAACLAVWLSACGGGGGGDSNGKKLEVSFNYATPDPTYAVWTPLEQSPTLQGLEGESPSCALSGGSLPEGVKVVSSTCAIKGTPEQLGQFDYTVTLTVKGFSGSVSASGRMEVVKPAVFYQDSGALTWNQSWTATPQLPDGFVLQAGDTVDNYRVVDSSLPAGLSIDQATGVISGIFTGLSAGRFGVAATLTHAGKTLDIESAIFDPIVVVPSIVYPPSAQTEVNVGTKMTMAGPVFDDGSAIAAPYKGSFRVELGSQAPCLGPQSLPAGLTLNATTGVISGTPTQAFSGCLAMRYEVTGPGGGSVFGWLRVPLAIYP